MLPRERGSGKDCREGKEVSTRGVKVFLLIGSILIGRDYRRSGTLLRLKLLGGEGEERKEEEKAARSFYRVPLFLEKFTRRANDARQEGKRNRVAEVYKRLLPRRLVSPNRARTTREPETKKKKKAFN